MIINLNQILIIINNENNKSRLLIIDYILTLNKPITKEEFKNKLILFCLRNIKEQLINVSISNTIKTNIINPSNLLFNIDNNVSIFKDNIKLKDIKHNINIIDIKNLITKLIEYSNVNNKYNDLILVDKDNYIVDGKFNYIKSCLFNNETNIYKIDDVNKEAITKEIKTKDVIIIKSTIKDIIQKETIYDLLNQYKDFDLFIKNNNCIIEWIKLGNDKKLIKEYLINNLVNNNLIDNQ